MNTATAIAEPFKSIFNIFGFTTAVSPNPKRPDGNRPKVAEAAKRRRAYICSPLKGDIARNIGNAKRYARFAYDMGYHPIAPHIYYPLFLSDGVTAERADALEWGLDALKGCDEVWAFGASITDGMRREIELAKRRYIPVRYFSENCREE